MIFQEQYRPRIRMKRAQYRSFPAPSFSILNSPSSWDINPAGYHLDCELTGRNYAFINKTLKSFHLDDKTVSEKKRKLKMYEEMREGRRKINKNQRQICKTEKCCNTPVHLFIWFLLLIPFIWYLFCSFLILKFDTNLCFVRKIRSLNVAYLRT